MDINYTRLNERVPIEEIYNPDYLFLYNTRHYQMVYDNHLKIKYDYLTRCK